MNEPSFYWIDSPSLLEFHGPDAVRFLNGQVTQDVRLVAGGRVSLPACVTDAKGRLQFRVWITESPEGGLWVQGPSGTSEALEERLTKYLIADDVEVINRTGSLTMAHLPGAVPEPPAEIVVRASNRLNIPGNDWFIPTGAAFDVTRWARQMGNDEVELLRLTNGAPSWGRELIEGILPPEAGLEATDISYQKGCYIGQEVISRMKSAGKVRKRLVRIKIHSEAADGDTDLTDENGAMTGTITSLSSPQTGGWRVGLAFVKQGATRVFHGGREVHVEPLPVSGPLGF